MMTNSIRTESELLDIVRKAIEGGYTPILEINGERYDFPLSYLMTEGDRCMWHCSNGKCGLASWAEKENPMCDGGPEDIEVCRRIKRW